MMTFYVDLYGGLYFIKVSDRMLKLYHLKANNEYIFVQYILYICWCFVMSRAISYISEHSMMKKKLNIIIQNINTP